MSATKAYAFRLKPGQDLKQEIQKLVMEKQIKAGWIDTCVGSLANYQIRFANQSEAGTGSGHFEILSLCGTVSIHGSHLHISIGDSTGRTMGGHLTEGNIIYTTAEIVLTASNELEFTRDKDESTGWNELQIKIPK